MCSPTVLLAVAVILLGIGVLANAVAMILHILNH
jgi:hypothetical protein